MDDVPYKVGVPSLPLEIGERLTLGCGVLDGLDEEHVEVIAAGDLFLDAEDGGLELLYQDVLFGALPLHEVQNMLSRVGVWPCGDPAISEDLCAGGRGEVGAVFDCYNEGLLRGDQAKGGNARGSGGNSICRAGMQWCHLVKFCGASACCR